MPTALEVYSARHTSVQNVRHGNASILKATFCLLANLSLLISEDLLNATWEVVQECGEGWVKFMGSCYIHSNERKTWTSAEQHCQELNAHLVSIQVLHMMYVGELLHIQTKNKESEFRWTDGSPLQFENWRTNQPDDYFNSEDCVVMIWHEFGQWNDVPCNYHLPFTCKSGPGKRRFNLYQFM
uniref:C-type lectin domain-containing protein n=1 Tax=Astyanax mexicanus TaxID=7994 RepID=A0A3B1IS38_ASTMX